MQGGYPSSSVPLNPEGLSTEIEAVSVMGNIRRVNLLNGGQ
jgi:hypothetical protein